MFENKAFLLIVLSGVALGAVQKKELIREKIPLIGHLFGPLLGRSPSSALGIRHPQKKPDLPAPLVGKVWSEKNIVVWGMGEANSKLAELEMETHGIQFARKTIAMGSPETEDLRARMGNPPQMFVPTIEMEGKFLRLEEAEKQWRDLPVKAFEPEAKANHLVVYGPSTCSITQGALVKMREKNLDPQYREVSSMGENLGRAMSRLKAYSEFTYDEESFSFPIVEVNGHIAANPPLSLVEAWLKE